MQRQSVGSPGTNHHHGGVAAVNGEKTATTEPSSDSKRLSSTTTSSHALNAVVDTDDDEEKTKLLKPHRSSPSASKQNRPEKLLHCVPILTFVCFLILYLSSHDPSQSELDAFGGFARPKAVIDARSVSGGGGVAVVSRRRRDLREAAGKIRVHRR